VEIPRGEIVSEAVGARRALPDTEEIRDARWARHALPLQFGLVAFAIVVLDQLCKFWIRRTLVPGATIDVIPGWVHLSHSLNDGAAWGMMSGQRWLLIAVSIGVSIFIVKLAREFESRGVLALSALGLIFGGAIGNLIDRIVFGHVTDMIDLDTPLEYLRTFPVFNIADSALTIGVILLILDFLLRREPEKIVNRKS
jgi:signal peptidase II